MSLFTSCEGVFDGLYDDAKTAPPIDGTLYVEAKEWDKWYYIDLQTLHEHIKNDPLYDVNKDWQSFNIPMADTDTPKEYVSGHHKTGQYMYWFDGTIGQAVKGHEFRYFTQTEEQEAPEEWTFAVHRSEVRTNGGAVLETSLTNIMDVNIKDWKDSSFQPDVWSETDVWDDPSQMLLQLIPCQGIYINKVLSSWLSLGLMPNYIMNNHVFLLRLSDGSYAALQLVNHLSPSGVRCCLTIKFRYPIE